MKTLLALVVGLSLISACDDDNMMTMMPPDLSVPADLLPAPGSCAAVLGCTLMCTAANVQTCGPTCASKISATAKPFFDPLNTCIFANCLTADVGLPPCADPSSGACMACAQAMCGSELNTCLMH